MQINLRAVQQSNRRFLAQHDASVLRALNDSRNAGLRYVQTNPGFKPQTGETQRATTGQVIRTARLGIVRLQNRKPHAAALDKGARPHLIRARGNGVLRFTAGGAIFFRKQVEHPGNRAYGFLSRATTHAGETFAREMASSMTAIARRF